MPRIHSAAAAARRTTLVAAMLASAAACGVSSEHRRADSLNAALSEQQRVLATQLGEQKDSLMSVVLDADRFLGQIDSSISRVKGLPRRERGKQAEGVLQQQLEARRDMLFKVDALVKRAQSTAAQLAAARRREAGLRDDNAALRDSLGKDERLIAELGQTIQRQLAQITELETNVAQLTEANARLGRDLASSLADNARAYYVIGREDELVKKGIIVREGGMNLLVLRPGRTVHAARALDPALFQHIDAREVTNIMVPDPSKRYRIVSRHSLDAAEVDERRNATTFRGHLRIKNAERFWSASRYLIVIEG
ncbi:MAG TPA: hypothetical protein VEA99_18870 [Gemmatimonadaceae bacterium]|nr:hypothetical protein [Gemmatimonadaceae bacterium]